MTKLPLHSELPNPDQIRNDEGGFTLEPANTKDDGEVLQVRMRRRVVDILDRFYNRRNITHREYQAGLYFQQLYFNTHRQAKITANYNSSGIRGQSSDDPFIGTVEARKQYEALRKELKVLQVLELERVCGLGIYHGTWKDWRARRRTRNHLKDGLNVVADYLKLP